MKASDLFVKCLESEGVEYVFGLPGGEWLDLLDVLFRSRIQFISADSDLHAGTIGLQALFAGAREGFEFPLQDHRSFLPFREGLQIPPERCTFNFTLFTSYWR
jgi:hypothetical protein